MRIAIITPAPSDSRYGNRITAVRWARILRRLGNRVSISQIYDGEPYDLLVALHARKSHSSIVNFRRHKPSAPIIVALTGTDLYRDIRRNHRAQESLDISTRIVVLQPKAIDELRLSWRKKTRVMHQSVYRWLDEQPQSRVHSILSKSSLCVLSSRLEGGANVLSEALAARVPIIASRVDGNVGILGKGCPGYFEVGNTTQLARLLTRAETPAYLAELKAWTKGLAVLADPSREEKAWSDLINELFN